MPEISVMMLTHNRAELVGRMIECIQRQTFSDYEFLIFDTDSSDGSGDICENYAEKDKRIRVWHIENKSIGRSRNVAVSKSSGRYMTFIDDDDMVTDDFLDFLYKLITEHDSDISICGAERNTNSYVEPHGMWNEKCLWTAKEALTELILRRRNFQRMPTKLIKRELFEKIPFKEDCCFEDIWVCYRFMAEACSIAAHGIPKYVFFRNSDNNSSFVLTDKWKPEQLDEYLRAYSERTEYISEKFPELKDLCDYSEWSFMLSMCDKIKKLKLKECEKIFEQMIGVLYLHDDEIKGCEYLNALDVERAKSLL